MDMTAQSTDDPCLAAAFQETWLHALVEAEVKYGGPRHLFAKYHQSVS